MHECTCNLRSLTRFVVSPIRFVKFVHTVQHDLAYIIRIKQNLYILLTEKSADLRPKYNTLIYCEKILAVAKKRNGIDSLTPNWHVHGYYLWIFSMAIWTTTATLFTSPRSEHNLSLIKHYSAFIYEATDGSSINLFSILST